MLHSRAIFRSITGPDDTGQVDLQTSAFGKAMPETTPLDKVTQQVSIHMVLCTATESLSM